MSRIGKKIIQIPAKTEVTLENTSAGVLLTVKGPLGTLAREFKNDIGIVVSANDITLTPVKETLASRALWGTYSSHIQNMINGVNTLFAKKLILEGIGYKSEVKGTNLQMALGFSHPVIVAIPADLKVTAEKNLITVSGMNKEIVGSFAASLRDLKKPEPYKGKGMRYEGEVIKRKQGKKTA